MRILITNDDGIDAPGLNALAAELSKAHEVQVVAPSSQRSASAHAITVRSSLGYKIHSKNNRYAVEGTPADCVKLAVLFLFKDRLPDLIIAGINDNSNLGSDTLYSGTVSAALEAAYMGIKGIAVSMYHRGEGALEMGGFSRTAKFVSRNLGVFTEMNIGKYTILNINHPDTSPCGAVITHLAHNYYNDHYVVSGDDGSMQLTGEPVECPDAESDLGWANKNYVTVTPIKLDRNDYTALSLNKDVKFL